MLDGQIAPRQVFQHLMWYENEASEIKVWERTYERPLTWEEAERMTFTLRIAPSPARLVKLEILTKIGVPTHA